ncbi:hypothetical protein NPIL_349241 [Nephila pilipes]|uniref:Uncharacterized protein n=1 Tax=Nephila pilipes TaxID=299642 RepID=A0A8X6R134_NEPPI|nr:hypothetical protein NPIL_349241 [Nephila pilipes]
MEPTEDHRRKDFFSDIQSDSGSRIPMERCGSLKSEINCSDYLTGTQNNEAFAKHPLRNEKKMSALVRFQCTMTTQRYADDVLWPVTLSYHQGAPNTLYQQGNDQPHTTYFSRCALQGV